MVREQSTLHETSADYHKGVPEGVREGLWSALDHGRGKGARGGQRVADGHCPTGASTTVSRPGASSQHGHLPTAHGATNTPCLSASARWSLGYQEPTDPAALSLRTGVGTKISRSPMNSHSSFLSIPAEK